MRRFRRGVRPGREMRRSRPRLRMPGVRRRSSRLRGRPAWRRNRLAQLERVHQRLRAGLFIEPAAMGRGVLQGFRQADGFSDFGGAQAARLLSLDSRAMRFHRSCLLNAPINRPCSLRLASTGTMRATPSSVPFSTAHSKRSNLISARYRVNGAARQGGNLFDDLEKADEIFARGLDGRQPGAIVIGDFEFLAGLDAKNAREMQGVLTGDFSLSFADLIDKKTAACHVQCLRHPHDCAAARDAVTGGETSEPGDPRNGRRRLRRHHPDLDFFEASDAGAKTKLRIYTHVREDVIALYGFLTADEKNLFEKLIGSKT